MTTGCYTGCTPPTMTAPKIAPAPNWWNGRSGGGPAHTAGGSASSRWGRVTHHKRPPGQAYDERGVAPRPPVQAGG